MTPQSASEPVRADQALTDDMGPTVEPQPVADLAGAPLPTASTLRRRSNVPFQATRFVSFNLRILRMAAKGHR